MLLGEGLHVLVRVPGYDGAEAVRGGDVPRPPEVLYLLGVVLQYFSYVDEGVQLLHAGDFWYRRRFCSPQDIRQRRWQRYNCWRPRNNVDYLITNWRVA